MKKFFDDFKKFIKRGNVFDLAIGVVVGAAFTSIVTALSNGIIMPLIKILLMRIGGNNFDSIYTILHGVYTTDPATGQTVLDLTNSIYIDWGAFITAVINFFIIAITLFVVLRVAMRSSELFKKAEQEIKKIHLTKADKIELKNRGISLKNKEAVKAYKEEKQKMIEEKLKAEQNAKVQADNQMKIPNQEQLLTEIRDLLKDMKNSSK